MKELNQEAVAVETIPHKYKFSDDEIQDMRKEHTDVIIEEEIILDEIKAFREERKLPLKNLKEQSKKLRKHIKNGYEIRDVECSLVPNFETGMMQYISNDTQEIIIERKLQPNEKQYRIKTA